MTKDVDLFIGLTSSQPIGITSTINITNSTAFINSTMKTNRDLEELEVVIYIFNQVWFVYNENVAHKAEKQMKVGNDKNQIIGTN